MNNWKSKDASQEIKEVLKLYKKKERTIKLIREVIQYVKDEHKNRTNRNARQQDPD